MQAICASRARGRGLWGLVVGLVLCLTCGPAQGQEDQSQSTRGDDQRGWARVTVEGGRLSVDLRQADIQTVLALIRTQTGISIVMPPLARNPLSVQFTGVDLDQGLRRLLRLAALSYAIRYATGATGVRAVQEVRVFGAGQGVAAAPGVRRDAAGQGDPIGQRFAEALLRDAATPTPAGEESEAARRFRDAFERPRERQPEPTPADSEASRLFREALERAREQTPPATGAGTGDSPEAQSFRQAFERFR